MLNETHAVWSGSSAPKSHRTEDVATVQPPEDDVADRTVKPAGRLKVRRTSCAEVKPIECTRQLTKNGRDS